MNPEAEIIERNRRGGRVLWAHVAAQMGRAEATVRAQYAELFPDRAPPAPPPAAPSSYTPPVTLPNSVLAVLAEGPHRSREIAAKVDRSLGSVQVCLSVLHRSGAVVMRASHWTLAAGRPPVDTSAEAAA